MKKVLILIVGMVLLSACASTHPGNVAVAHGETDLPLKLSGETISVGTSYQLVEVTFENTGGEWLKISRAEMVIKNPAVTKLSVVTGQDLKDWAHAMALKEKMENNNKQVLQSGIILAGAVLAGSDNKNAATAGAAVALGGTAWAVTDAIRMDLRNVEGVKAVPENHLYHPFSVPGGMFNRRWIVVNIPAKEQLGKMVLEVETAEGKKGTYVVSL